MTDSVRTRDPDRRERILRAAAELVAERGFHAVSMADIGAASGIVGSGVYRHFDSKSAVLVALLDEGMERLLAGAAAAVGSGRPEPTASAAVRCSRSMPSSSNARSTAALLSKCR